MAREISIEVTARDSFTDTITKIRNAQTPFRKDLTALDAELKKLNNNKVNLKVDMSAAKNELKAAERAFAGTASEANKLELVSKQAKYNNLKSNLDEVSRSARNAEKDISKLSVTTSKAENKAGGFGSGKGGALGGLAKAGLIQMGGQALMGVANSGIGSALGDDAGTMASSAISGIASGAAMGSLLGAPGMAVGAAVGAITGVVQGATQVFEKKDEAFKNVVKDSFEQRKQEEQATLTSGSAIAGKREKQTIAFSTILGGDDAAKSYLSDMTQFAAKTPFQYDELTAMSKTMLAYGYKVDELLPTLSKIGDTGASLGWDADNMNQVATYLGRMKTTGKTTLEYLNPLLERGVKVFDYLAESMGKTKEQVQEMVSKGLIPGATAAQIIADSMGQEFGGGMSKQAASFEGVASTLQDAKDGLDNAMGEGWNDRRKQGMIEETAYLEGEGGQRLKDAYSAIGNWKAGLENQHQKLINNNLEATMNSRFYKESFEKYEQAKLNGDTEAMNRESSLMGSMLAKAKVQGEADYMASDGYKVLQDSQLATIKGIQATWKEDENWKKCGYDIGIEMSKGLAASFGTNMTKNYTTNYNNAIAIRNSPQVFMKAPESSNAFGMRRVPYDNYPALLHEGERVLTAEESRKKSAPTVSVTGNVFNVREEADIDKVAAALASKIRVAQAVM